MLLWRFDDQRLHASVGQPRGYIHLNLHSTSTVLQLKGESSYKNGSNRHSLALPIVVSAARSKLDATPQRGWSGALVLCLSGRDGMYSSPPWIKYCEHDEDPFGDPPWSFETRCLCVAGLPSGWPFRLSLSGMRWLIRWQTGCGVLTREAGDGLKYSIEKCLACSVVCTLAADVLDSVVVDVEERKSESEWEQE